MQEHTVSQLLSGPRARMWVYIEGNQHGRYIECCAEAAAPVMQAPHGSRAASPHWQDIGHATAADAYAHMRTVRLDRLILSSGFSGWSSCTAPVSGGMCGEPTNQAAALPKLLLYQPLCDRHRNRETVESMWNGPGDWVGLY
ncbi:hypothetical protein [Streptomyces sp. NPDC002176]|uniref:hypothetical protein n=1 Tax=Streptomyces sp. NPDC002176 TaxID=3364634 RepID=UPI00384E75EB